ncbi:MAG TPA: ABC transporter ATP-binding protein [Thermoplasmata archaeon]|nr:ABC transporter ATP-binding protein [Thermoplasmata archaeon]
MSSEQLVVRDLSSSWDGRPVLDRVSFSVAAGSLAVLMGPNGAGKTTLLRAIAGLEGVDAGTVAVGGRDVTHQPAHRRGIGFLFQEPALFTHRTVWENIAYGLEVRGDAREPTGRRVRELAALLRLDDLLARRADELSGGEQQRVALARTLAPSPKLILFDEPFASVDPELRGALAAEFRRLLGRLGATGVFVTHDRGEGLFLGDRILLLFGGRIVQEGAPDDVYRSPASSAVARFLGYNILHQGEEDVAVLPQATHPGGAAAEGIDAEVVASGRSGPTTVTHLTTGDRERIEAREPAGAPLRRPGERVRVTWDAAVRFPADRQDGGDSSHSVD